MTSSRPGVPLLALLAACSRGEPASDAPPLEADAGGNIPAAASGAILAPPAVPSISATTPPPATAPLPHTAPPHIVDLGPTLSNAGLPQEVVHRIVRINFGRFRLCYEVAGDPTLTGTVKIRFVIDASGAVTSATDAGSLLPEGTVITCIRHAFEALSFPSPSTASVVVVYGLSFAPGP